MKNRITGVLALLSVVLYVSGFWICEFFYRDDITEWRFLRDTLTGVVIAVLVLLNFMPKTRLKTASLYAFGVFCFGNLADRVMFNIGDFVISDWFLIATAVIIFLYKLKGYESNPG